MISKPTNDVLNRLLIIHHRSLPMYLSYAHPRVTRGHEATAETLESIVADQKAMVDRIGRCIVDEEGSVDFGEFPMLFTGLHDISLDYLLQKLIEYQQRSTEQIQQCVDDLRLAPTYQALAQEALGLARGHLESLEELNAEPASSAAT